VGMWKGAASRGARAASLGGSARCSPPKRSCRATPRLPRAPAEQVEIVKFFGPSSRRFPNEIRWSDRLHGAAQRSKAEGGKPSNTLTPMRARARPALSAIM